MSGSLTVPEQLSRWQIILSQSKTASNTGLEIIVMGDMNVSHLDWLNTEEGLSNQTRKSRPLIEELFSRIIPLGFFSNG